MRWRITLYQIWAERRQKRRRGEGWPKGREGFLPLVSQLIKLKNQSKDRVYLNWQKLKNSLINRPMMSTSLSSSRLWSFPRCSTSSILNLSRVTRGHLYNLGRIAYRNSIIPRETDPRMLSTYKNHLFRIVTQFSVLSNRFIKLGYQLRLTWSKKCQEMEEMVEIDMSRKQYFSISPFWLIISLRACSLGALTSSSTLISTHGIQLMPALTHRIKQVKMANPLKMERN